MDFDLDRPYLILEGITIDDDMQGASHGDGDGVIEFGETIELTLSLYNLGHEDAHDVTGEISTGSAFVGISVGTASFGDILSGETVANAEPFIFDVAPDVPDGEVLTFVADISEDPGTIPLEFEAHAPTYFVGVVEIDDTVGGNGNGIPEPGETVEITLAVDNVGGRDSPDLEAVLDTASQHFLPDETPHHLGVIEVGQGVTAGGFTIEIPPTCPPFHAGYLLLGLSGPDEYAASVPFVFCVDQVFADQMEMDAASWRHYSGPGSWEDEWHRETYRNHSPGGERSWKCGGAGTWNYGNLVYAVLETAEFVLPAGSRLEFWHWMDAETSQAFPDHCYDGGLLEISTDGGSIWLPLTPESGYPHLIRDGAVPGPFTAETPVWSGQQDWTEVGVDLSGHEGLAKLRWVFGSDGADTEEGWYIDDVRIGPGWPSGAEPDPPELLMRPRLFAVCPNPAAVGVASGSGSADVVLRFALPQAAEARLSLFDAGGRLIRILACGSFVAGEHKVAWDGMDAAGLPVRAGSYYCRLSIGGMDQTRKLTILRR